MLLRRGAAGGALVTLLFDSAVVVHLHRSRGQWCGTYASTGDGDPTCFDDGLPCPGDVGLATQQSLRLPLRGGIWSFLPGGEGDRVKWCSLQEVAGQGSHYGQVGG